jgi:hypothetical protein
LGAMVAIGMVLGSRLLLVMAVTGAFVLAMCAMREPSVLGLSIVGAFCVLTVIPLVMLDIRTRGR